jgi:hypothetical protein
MLRTAPSDLDVGRFGLAQETSQGLSLGSRYEEDPYKKYFYQTLLPTYNPFKF